VFSIGYDLRYQDIEGGANDTDLRGSKRRFYAGEQSTIVQAILRIVAGNVWNVRSLEMCNANKSPWSGRDSQVST
jgi:hypothetical protein